jgi:hypothetical protein
LPTDYHLGVRRIVLILMIALLPLRGWMGDAMATQMAAHAAARAPAEMAVAAHGQADDSAGSGFHHARQQALLDSAPNTGHEQADHRMPPDCAQHAAEPAGDDEAKSEGDCANCAFCQACHTVALTETGPSVGPSFGIEIAPRSAAAQFASADAAPGKKPPIS